MTKGKEEVVYEVLTWPVALVEDSPATFFATAAADILFGDATRMAHRRGDAKRLHKARPPC
jgi:hypothetical protein